MVQTGGGKLAFFVQDLRGGGAERNVVRRVNFIAALGHDVDLVLVRKRGDYLGEVDPRVNVVDLDCRRTMQAIPRLAAYIDRVRPVALSAHMTHTNVAAVLARMMARHKPRLVVVEHNQFDRNLALKTGLVRLAYRSAGWAYRFADGIGAVAKGVATTLSRELDVPLERITVIYNPVVDDTVFERAREPASHPFLAGPDPVLVAVGRLTRQKNYPLLLEAMARLAVPARLIVLGEGDLRAELEARRDALGLSGRVDFPGFLPNPFAVMAAADAFVMSSDWEGLPTVLIEALACGTPVVSTDCPSGPSEILEEGRFGRLVPCGDAEALARAIEATLADPGEAAPRIAQSKVYSMENCVRLHLGLMGVSFEPEARRAAA